MIPTIKPRILFLKIFSISDALAILINNEQLEAENYAPSFSYQVQDIMSYIREQKTIAFLSEEHLKNLLAKHLHLFEFVESQNAWRAKLDIATMRNALAISLKRNFKKALITSECLYSGIDRQTKRVNIYQMPSTGKFVKEYIWTYKLLQTDYHIEEISKRLKHILDEYFISQNNKDFSGNFIGAILSITAPARMLAEAIARQFHPPPPVFDLGTINDLDPDEMMTSFSPELRSCIIVTDVLATKTLVGKLINTALKANVKVLAVASIIRFVKENADSWVEQIIDIDFKDQIHIEDFPIGMVQTIYPVAVLYDYPNREVVDDIDATESYQRYWIEPYSLRPFLVDSLTKPYYAWESEGRIREFPRRITMLDRKGCILYGHFKNRNHHNRIIIHTPRALQDDDIANEICDDILAFIGNFPPAVIIVPLHSSIHYLIPHLKRKLREKSLNLVVICTIAVDLKGRGPFYILPDEAIKVLEKVEKKSILFLDDAILTGRTVNTFLRAIITALSGKRTTPLVERISVYCIINRTGRAASTKWRIISKLLPGIDFFFKEFVRFECPVYTPNDCPICAQIQHLEDYLARHIYTEKRVVDWVAYEQRRLAPIVLRTKAHLEYASQELNIRPGSDPEFIDFLRIDSPMDASISPQGNYSNRSEEVTLHTVDGALWWFWERGYRGSPPFFLLEEFKKWVDSKFAPSGESFEIILNEIIGWSLDNLSHLRTKKLFPGSPEFKEPLPEIFFELIFKLINLRSSRIPSILEKAASTLCGRSFNEIAFNDLLRIFDYCLDQLRSNNSEDSSSRILLGLYLVVIRVRKRLRLYKLQERFSSKIKELSSVAGTGQGYFRTLDNFINSESSSDDLIYILNLLSQERFKERHSTILLHDARVFVDRKVPIKSFDYLIDSLPRLVRAVNYVFGGQEICDKKLFSDMNIITEYSKIVCNMIQRGMEDEERERLLVCVQQISYRLSGKDSAIGERIDRFNPSIYENLGELRRETKVIQDRNPEMYGELIVEPEKDPGIHILGDGYFLRMTLRNHIWDVFRDHRSKLARRIKIRVYEKDALIHLAILNSWVDITSARTLVQKGASLSMEMREWERFKAEVSYPVNSDEDGYQSMLLFKFQKGFSKEDRNG